MTSIDLSSPEAAHENDNNIKKNNLISSVEPSTSLSEEDNSAKSISNDEKDVDFSDIDKAKLIRKLDWRLIPLFTILYLVSFLDRGNIGNAKIEGLADDLKLTGSQYNNCLTIFFVFYAGLEIPSNVIIKKFRPSIFILIAMILWGIVMTLMGLVKNYNQLLACRALLGIFEAPLFPGISFFLSMYYCKNEFLIREAVFFSAASIAGAFSGLLAAAITKMDGIGGLEGWRYIFILEGALSILVAICAFLIFPDLPADAKFLTPREREFVLYRVKHDNNRDTSKLNKNASDLKRIPPRGEDHSNDKRYFWAVISDWQTWGQLFLYFGIVVPLYGVSLFAPTIIRSLGYGNTKTQLLTVPIYILAAIVCICQAIASSKLGVRSPFILFNYMCLLSGYLVCVCLDSTKHPRGIYGATFVLALGVYPAFPMVVVWYSNNLSGAFKRAIGMAFQIGIGNFGGAFSSNMYRATDAPHYKLGHGLEVMFVAIGLVALVILFVGYNLANADKKKKLESGFYDDYTDEELLKMGDKSPYYLYRL